MYPINQVILGGESMFNSNIDNIDAQIQKMESYKQKLKQLLHFEIKQQQLQMKTNMPNYKI